MIGKSLRTIRNQKGITLHKLWKDINKKVDLVRLSAIDRGMVKIDLEELKLICDYLELDYDWWLKIWESEDNTVYFDNQQIEKDMNRKINLIDTATKDKKPNEAGVVQCICGGHLHWEIHCNGHVWAKCSGCDFGVMQ